MNQIYRKGEDGLFGLGLSIIGLKLLNWIIINIIYLETLFGKFSSNRQASWNYRS